MESFLHGHYVWLPSAWSLFIVEIVMQAALDSIHKRLTLESLKMGQSLESLETFLLTDTKVCACAPHADNAIPMHLPFMTSKDLFMR